MEPIDKEKIYRVVIFPRDDSEIRHVMETYDKDYAISTAKKLANGSKIHNVVVSEFELNFKQFVFKTDNRG